MNNPISKAATPWSALTKHRALTLEMAKRDVLGRYRGATFGLVWSLASPIAMLAVYTLAFGEIMKSRWPGSSTTADFSLIIFVGIIAHGFLSECMIRAPTLIVSNSNYVKKIVFPLEILPWQMTLSALFHAAMNFVVFALFFLTLHKGLHWTIVLLPIVFLPLVVMAVGIGWLLSALAVYVRDIQQVVTPLSTAMLFLSSAIVPVELVPEKFRVLFQLNPLTLIIDQARTVALWGQSPDFAALGMYSVAAIVVALLGFACFSATKEGFADVL
ncbi:ABC transporter permease [Pseudoxanthomonas sp. J35]|uniref:ABC transporter permease n=1 Tax=Pseudoxanthomonas sp. J35 TaxID=935852 RepID=UPI0005601601|nr:ABC transporter permease [Pseudoxanthomonas sp. J35]